MSEALGVPVVSDLVYPYDKSPSRSQLFKNDRCRKAFEKLNSKHKIWAKRSVILDEVDPAIRANLESRGWLFL